MSAATDFYPPTHLAALDGGSPQNVLRCLRALFDHGYLDRPKAQLASVPLEGPQAMVYGLAPKGARLLREHGHHLIGGGDWTEKNKRAGAVFLEHTLAVADFMTAVELSCRARSDIDLIREHEVIADAPEETRNAREPLRWFVRPERAKRSVVGGAGRPLCVVLCGRDRVVFSVRNRPRHHSDRSQVFGPSQHRAQTGDLLRRMAGEPARRAIRRQADARADSDGIGRSA